MSNKNFRQFKDFIIAQPALRLCDFLEILGIVYFCRLNCKS